MKLHRCAATPLLATPLLLLSATLAHAQDEANAQEGPPREGDARRAEGVQAFATVPGDSPAGRFGGVGQLAVSSDAGFSLENTSISGQDGSVTRFVLRPAVDYFVVDHLSIGGFLGLDYTSSPGGSGTALSVGPRVGYDIPLAERLSLWPKIGFSFASTTQTVEGVDVGGVQTEDEEETNTAMQLNLFAPVLFHPVQHFFIGLGPAFDLDLTGDNKATTVGLRLAMGGWL